MQALLKLIADRFAGSFIEVLLKIGLGLFR